MEIKIEFPRVHKILWRTLKNNNTLRKLNFKNSPHKKLK